MGFALGGPLGAAVGVGIGHYADVNSKTTNETDSITVICPYCEQQVTIKSEGSWICPHCNETFTYRRTGTAEEKYESATIFITTTFSMLGKLAKVDGVVTKQEIDVIQKFINQNLKLSNQEADIAKRIFNQAKYSSEPFERFADQFSILFTDNFEVRYGMLELLIEVATANGALHSEEERLVLYAMKAFGISRRDYERIIAKYYSSLDRYYAVLGCNKFDSDEVVKRKYRALMRKYHPDLIASKGLPTEFVEFANQKTKEIIEAYEIIIKERQG